MYASSDIFSGAPVSHLIIYLKSDIVPLVSTFNSHVLLPHSFMVFVYSRTTTVVLMDFVISTNVAFPTWVVLLGIKSPTMMALMPDLTCSTRGKSHANLCVHDIAYEHTLTHTYTHIT